MAVPISAERMVTKIRAKIEDRSTTNPRWSNADILAQIDLAVQYLLNEQGKQRQDHDLDFVDLVVATETNNAGTMANTGQVIKEWRVPDYINKIRLIENTTDASHPLAIPKFPLELKESFRNDWLQQPNQFWTFTEGGDLRQRIGFIGGLTGVNNLRVWFIRRAAPLHYGIAQAGDLAVASTNARIWFANPALPTTVGRIVNKGFAYVNSTGATVAQADTYKGALVEFGQVGGVTIDGVTDEIRKLVDAAYIQVNAAPIITAWTWLFDEGLKAFPIASVTLPCAGFNYSLVPQIGPEYHELVILMSTVRLAEEAGSNRILATLGPKLDALHADFIESTQDRQTQTPEFVEQYDDWYP